MYKLSEAAASDIEAILTRSVLDFGVERTETYFQSLTHCLELLGDNPEMGSTVDDIRQGYRCFLHESHVIGSDNLTLPLLKKPSSSIKQLPYSNLQTLSS